MWMLNKNKMAFLRRPALILRSGVGNGNRNRMMSSGGVINVSSGGAAARAPLLIIGMGHDEDPDPGMTYKLWNWAEDVAYSLFDNKRKRAGDNFLSYSYAEVRGIATVGSSQGWLAYQSRRDMFLVDPMRYRCRHLPRLDTTTTHVYNVVLDTTTTRAFMISSGPEKSKSLSFCWVRNWTVLGADQGYESMVYCVTRQRLLCLTRSLKLEAWDVGAPFPRLDYVMDLHFRGTSCTSRCRYPYVVSRWGDGRLFVVDRDETVCDFVVYRVDGEKEELVRMEGSLEGMTIFLGVNEPLAMMILQDPADDFDAYGLPRDGDRHGYGPFRPNCIYHTHDRRIHFIYCACVFDYQKGKHIATNSELNDFMEDSCKILRIDPAWFIPH